MTPNEFAESVRRLIQDNQGDPESFHSRSDTLMENLLIELGYAEGVNLIQEQTRWYA